MSLAPDLLDHGQRPVRILVADADADMRALYRESLQLAGCDVVDAADGRDALVKALSVRPTLVITETRLPIVDGYALCDVLRRDAQTRTVPILVVTAETRPTQLDRARAADVDGVLTKPITSDQLLEEIRRVLGRGEHSPPLRDTANPPQDKQARTSQTKAHLRAQTIEPPAAPPALTCPSCDRPLNYEHSHVGGVSRRHAEQWDTYTCPASCGTFEYRQRTRKLRRVA
jgi:two-component system chemotaxis response regulator CheY